VQQHPDDFTYVLIYPFVGHLVGGTITGLFAAGVVKLLALVTPWSVYPGAWDDFVRVHAPDHWVVVGLQDGEVYAGKLKNADISVAGGDRDIVLEEPARYDAESGSYISTPYQHLFVRADNLYSIASYFEPGDKRTLAPGHTLFTETLDERQQTGSTSELTKAEHPGQGRVASEHTEPRPIGAAAAAAADATEISSAPRQVKAPKISSPPENP
jgi:hypothetical protein